MSNSDFDDLGGGNGVGYDGCGYDGDGDEKDAEANINIKPCCITTCNLVQILALVLGSTKKMAEIANTSKINNRGRFCSFAHRPF